MARSLFFVIPQLSPFPAPNVCWHFWLCYVLFVLLYCYQSKSCFVNIAHLARSLSYMYQYLIFFLQPWDQSFRNRSTLLFVVCVSFPAERSVCLLKRIRMSHNIAYRSVFHLYLPIIHKLKLWNLSVLERRLTDLSLFWVSLFFYRIYLIANYI